MKKILLLLVSLTLYLFSAQGLAKNGDVYYCEMKSFSSMSPSGFENYATNNFKFKFEKDKIVFDDKFEPSFATRELLLTFGDGENLTFARSSDDDVPQFVVFASGDLFFSYGNYYAVFTVIAECDKF